MARVPVSKPFNNFTGGLITEATGLSYPENSAIDLDNVDIELSGLIRRRLGLEIERDGNTLLLPFGAVAGFVRPEDVVVQAWRWRNAGNEPDRNYIVLQVGPVLRILDGNAESPSSAEASTAEGLGLNPLLPGAVVQGTTQYWIRSFLSDVEQSLGIIPPTFDLQAQIAFWTTPFHAVEGLGRMWFAGAHVVPFSLVYDRDLNTFRTAVIGQNDERAEIVVPALPAQPFLSYVGGANQTYAIRDFTGVEDGYRVNERRENISPAHAYNLLNQGWPMARADGSDAGSFFSTTAFRDSSVGRWPGNHDQRAFGILDDGAFDAGAVSRFSYDSAQSPRGNVLLYLPTGFRDRPNLRARQDATASPDPANPLTDVLNPRLNLQRKFNEPQAESFNTVTFFGQRIFLSGDVTPKRQNGVYYSQVLTSPNKAGRFFSENTPTSGQDSSVLATDGGVLYIPAAGAIVRLLDVGRGVLVFATNGVWFIYGGEANFSALDQVVDKISDIGCISPESVVSYEDQVFYWSATGIYQIVFDAGLAVNVQSITDSKIRSFFQRLDVNSRRNCRAFVDEFNKRIWWLYADAELLQARQAKNRALVYDMRTGAFLKHSFPVVREEGNETYGVTWINQGFSRNFTNVPARVDFITETDGTIITTLDGTPLQNWTEIDSYGANVSIKFVGFTARPAPLDPETSRIGVTEMYSTLFTDYFATTGGQNYDSYIETAPMLFEDLQRNKQATYVHSFFNKTEFGVVPTTDGTPEIIVQSGCSLFGKWNWHVTDLGGRWSDPQQAYKLRRPFAPVGEDEDVIDTGESLVYTKRKVRGKGRALSLRYESQPGLDFQLAGFSIDGTSATE